MKKELFTSEERVLLADITAKYGFSDGVEKLNYNNEALQMKFPFLPNSRFVSAHYLSDGYFDVMSLENTYREIMAVAYDANAIQAGLTIAKNHSIFGIAYATCYETYLKTGNDVNFPVNENLLYVFGRLLYKIILLGGMIPREYKKYIVWKKR